MPGEDKSHMTHNQQETITKLYKRLRDEIIPLFHKVLTDIPHTFREPALAESCDDIDIHSSSSQLHTGSEKQEQLLLCVAPCPLGKNKGSLFQNGQDCCDCAILKSSCPSIIRELGDHLHRVSFALREQNLQMAKDREYLASLQQKLNALAAELRTKEKEIQDIMITDKLTTLYNRQHLITVLEDEIARCQRYNRPIAIVMLDIDRFKDFNGKYGHQCGDQMLSYVGSLIKENTRKFDRAFRYGGEEFVIVLPESDLNILVSLFGFARFGVATLRICEQSRK